jgi:hypothetical protein
MRDVNAAAAKRGERLMHARNAKRRRLFNLATAVSLVLCGTSIMFWVRSYWSPELLFRRAGGLVADMVASDTGRLFLLHRTPTKTRPGPWERRVSSAPLTLRQMNWEQAPASEYEFAHFGVLLTQQTGLCVVALPYWALTSVTLLIPLLQIRIHVALRRRNGHCATCGYDLRATPERCPECGTAVPQKAVNA